MMRAAAARGITAWRATRRRVHPVRGATTVGGWVSWLAIRGAWPVVMACLQSQGCCIRWRRGIDAVAGGPGRIAAHLAFAAVVLWLLPDAGLLTAALLAPTVIVVVAGIGRLAYPHTPRGRARGRYRPDVGWARWHDLRDSMSAHAVRMSAVGGHDPTRPTLLSQATGEHSGRPAAGRTARIAATECGTPLGATCIGTPWPTRCYAGWRENVGVYALTGAGKSDLQCHQVIDHPGPVVVTQTKPGTYTRTAALRARKGPVLLVDPDGMTGLASTLRWSPVAGCANPATAMQRAGAMALAAGDVGEDNRWFVDRAATVLRVLLLTADVAGLGMDALYVWAAGGVKGLGEALKVMQRHEKAIPGGWVEAMDGLLSSEAGKQRDGILGILAGSVEFMSDPATATLAAPDPDRAPFDVETFIRARGTLYLIAKDRPHASAGPYLAALADHVFEQAQIVGRSRRIDPPLQINADEAANTIVLPLDRWLTDAIGWGIQLVYSVQSRSQLVARWGDAGARTIWNNSTVKLIAGGITDEQDLRAISEMCGEYLDLDDETGKAEYRPKLTPDDIRRIPRWTWLLVHRSTPITLVRTTSAARRRDVLAARAADVVHPAPPPIVITPAVERAELTYVPEQWTSARDEQVRAP